MYEFNTISSGRFTLFSWVILTVLNFSLQRDLRT